MRETTITRETKETNINCTINLDKSYGGTRNTGIAFLDHMLDAFALNADIYLDLQAEGDLIVDDHHTVEDVGIVLGQVLKESLCIDKVVRYGTSYIPMDEALSRVVLDISNRPFLVYDVSLTNERIGNMSLCNFKEFFRAFINESRITLHIATLYGENDHHMIESIFKAFGQALKQAIIKQDSIQSTKGVL